MRNGPNSPSSTYGVHGGRYPASASPRRTSAPAKVWNPGPASVPSDSPVNMDWSGRTFPLINCTSAAKTPPIESLTMSPGGGEVLPDAVTADRDGQRQSFLESGQSCLSARLLKETKRGVEHEEHGNDSTFEVLAEPHFQHNRRF